MLEVLARWFVRRVNLTGDRALLANALCCCRQETEEDTVKCCNPHCATQQFHLSCLGIDAVPKTWYCPKCRALPELKRGGSKQQLASIVNEALRMNPICTCKTVAGKKDKLVKCTNMSCTNGKFFHLSCLGRKRMPNNRQVWLCAAGVISNAREPTEGTATKLPATRLSKLYSHHLQSRLSQQTNPTVTHVTTNTKPTVAHVTTSIKPTAGLALVE